MAMRSTSGTLIGAVTLCMLAAATPAVAQQQRPAPTDTAEARRALQQQMGRDVSQAEVLERIRQSGLNRAQMRARLQQMGYDPGLADRYFDVLERGGEPPRGNASDSFLEALGSMGITTRGRIRADTLLLSEMQLDSLERERLLADTTDVGRMEVFGLRTFRRAGTQFRPVEGGPVDPGYRLGPGDELMLVLTGDVEAAYSLGVTREGHVFIPDVGQVSVAGLTLGELRDMLYGRLSRVYSGISRSPNASTRFQVSIGQLRTNQVFVRGEVAIPGAFQISSVGSLFTALYMAGGPTEHGSFRRVEVHRSGRAVQVVDLYEFLVGGSGAVDVRLEHNDHIFVPPAGLQVRLEGSVRRPAIYELRPGEGLRELMVFGGGLRSDALVRRVQIDRILPPEQQAPGRYRALVDADLQALVRGGGNVELFDGDVVNVFAVTDERRNRIVVVGEVRNPGLYEWTPGTTLWSMLNRADGVGERAYMSRAHVFRLVESDGTRRLIPVSLERDEAGRPLHDLPLADNDSIVVFDRAELRNLEWVSIHGFIRFPENYDLARGMTLQDLVLAAGGFIDGAYALEAELSRMPDPQVRTDTTAYILRVPLTSGGLLNGDPNELPEWLPNAADVELRHGDRVFIRRAPGYEPTRAVTITGQVLSPGTYVLASRNERLTDLLRRAGGLTPQAYPGGLHVVRRGRVVAGDLQRALNSPGDRNDIVLMEGDSIHAPALDPTVLVTGAVNFEARVLYVPGRALDYYINQAGGLTDEADARRVTVAYPNGERSGISRAVFGRGSPPVQPGSQIFVPAKPERTGVNWDQAITRFSAALSAAAAIMIAVSQFR